MAKISITMSDDLGAFVRGAMKDQKFDTTSEYFRHLVRQEYERQRDERDLRKMIDEGLQSGVSEDTVDAIWAEAIAEDPA